MGSISTSLDGRVAMVTGGGSGLGRAISTAFAVAGARVLVVDRAEHGAKETVRMIEGEGGEADAVHLDVSDADAVDRVFDDVSSSFGGAFDCLVNNAGTDRGADVLDVTQEQWQQVFGVNVDGPMHTSRAFVRHAIAHLADAGRPADIVNIGSISALTVGSGAGAYNASKAALAKFTEVLQTEARERGWPARVSLVHPAAMNTPMMDQWGLPPERMMDPAAVAHLVRMAITLPPEMVLQSMVVTLRNEQYPR